MFNRIVLFVDLMLKYVFIDESGDLGFKSDRGSSHFIITALIVDDIQSLDRIIKHFRRYTFKTELKKSSEIKGNKSSAVLKKKLLKQLNELDGVQVIHIFFEKQKLKNHYLRDDTHKLYNCVAGKIVKYFPQECEMFEIWIDKSKGKHFLREDFNQYFQKKLGEAGSFSIRAIHHSDSGAWSGLQFVDVLAWAEYQKICKNNSEFIHLIDFDKQQEHDVFEK